MSQLFISDELSGKRFWRVAVSKHCGEVIAYGSSTVSRDMAISAAKDELYRFSLISQLYKNESHKKLTFSFVDLNSR
jgi:hypothetical protein